MPGTNAPDRTAHWAPVLGAGVVAVAITAGYVGFRAAARIDLGGQAGAALFALAGVVGAAVVFSPCSFPLLVTLLAGSTADGPDRRRDSVRSAFAIAAGSAVFLILAGVVIGAVGTSLAAAVDFSSVAGRVVRGAVAGILVVAGLVQLGVLRLRFDPAAVVAGPLERRRTALAGEHRRQAQFVHGFGLVLVGFG